MSTVKCGHCFASSRVDDRQGARLWFGRHRRQDCLAARRSSPTGVDEPTARGSHHGSAPVGRERTVDAELAELRVRASRCKPIVLPDNDAPARHLRPASHRWTRTDHDAWGARREPGVRWTGGNCLMSTIAHLIGATDINTVPDNNDLVGNADWLPAYNERLGRIGYRLEGISTDRGLASRKPWIAVVDDASGGAHAVVAREQFVLFDPAGQLRGGLPIARLRHGLALTPTRRRVPVYAPPR
jgi:hypothetical protein